MLAFTIQFPNNNPAPPQAHPGNSTKPPPHQRTCSKHRTNTETPRTPPPTSHAPAKPPTQSGEPDQHPTHRHGGLLPQNPTACQTIQTAQHPHTAFQHPRSQRPPKRVLADAQTPCSHSQYPAHERTTHIGMTPACTLSSTESIDIPPMSNPPAPHSGTDTGNQ